MFCLQPGSAVWEKRLFIGSKLFVAVELQEGNKSNKLFQELKNIRYHLQEQNRIACLKAVLCSFIAENTLPFLESRTGHFAVLVAPYDCRHPNNFENPDQSGAH